VSLSPHEAGAVERPRQLAESRRVVRSRAGTIGYPDKHAIAVADCAEQIASRLRLGDNARRACVEGALLHDVGKLLVDRRILDKPGPLTPDERQVVNAHPVHGEKIVGDAVDRTVAQVIRCHHERWDGSGYPDGLSAGQIPLAARVVAVADAFLAMRERRPYRLPLTKRAALKELRRNAGSQFDPSCVEALVSILR
jgi:HD-GYP domain-containing protein (c-di-GMP phosphodiesterase class II)